MRERRCVASLPRIPAASLQPAQPRLSEQYRFIHLVCSCLTRACTGPPDCWTVKLAVDFTRASDAPAQSVPALCFSVGRNAPHPCSVLNFCSHARLCAEMPEVNYLISVSWMFIQVRRVRGDEQGAGRRRDCLEAHEAVVGFCQ